MLRYGGISVGVGHARRTTMFRESMSKLYVKAYLLLKGKEAASGIEYAIVATMVAVVLATFVSPISSHIKSIFTSIQTSIGT